MSDPEFDEVSGVEADSTDVVEQATSVGGDTVEGALQSRDRIAPTDAVEDELQAEDADEAAGVSGV